MHLHPNLTDQLVRDRHDQVRREFRRELGATRLRRLTRLRPREHERPHHRTR
ncbi:MAG: hypothetical protein U0Q03_10690 [Acidimicrobiales bacterium]